MDTRRACQPSMWGCHSLFCICLSPVLPPVQQSFSTFHIQPGMLFPIRPQRSYCPESAPPSPARPFVESSRWQATPSMPQQLLITTFSSSLVYPLLSVFRVFLLPRLLNE